MLFSIIGTVVVLICLTRLLCIKTGIEKYTGESKGRIPK